MLSDFFMFNLLFEKNPFFRYGSVKVAEKETCTCTNIIRKLIVGRTFKISFDEPCMTLRAV